MSKLKNLFKKQQKQHERESQQAGEDFVAVKVIPNSCQVVLTIAHDGKNASITQLEAGSKIPVALLQHGLMLIYNQLVSDVAVAQYKQTQAQNAPQDNANPPL